MRPKGSSERLLVLLMAFMLLAPGFAAMGSEERAGGDAPLAAGAAAKGQWAMFARDSSHHSRADAFAKGIPSAGTKWDRTLFIDSLSTVIGNFTGNVLATEPGTPWDEQLHCAVFTVGARVYVVEGSAGTNVWLLNITGTFSAAPAVGDVDGDGRADIVIASRTGVLYAYEPVILWNGTTFTWRGSNVDDEQLWNTSGRSVGSVTASSVVLDDLGSDGTVDVLVGSSAGVYCLDGRDGTELWNQTVSGVSISTPAVYRVSSQKNVIATSWNTTPSPDEMHVYTLRGTTGDIIKHLVMQITFVIGTYIPVAPPYFPSPVAADLDGQGDGDELVIVQPYLDNTARVHIYADGDLSEANEQFNISLGGSSNLDHLAHATPAVADMDGDGGLDLVVVSWRTYQILQGGNTYVNVTVLDGATGSRIWAKDIDETGPIVDPFEWGMASPALVDLTIDGRPDVVVFEYTGNIVALDGRNGTQLWTHGTRGFPSALATTSPAVGDLDQDGFPEIVLNGQAVSVMLPDLEVEPADITFTDDHPDEGEVVAIDVLVHNRGNADARDVLVSVYDNGALAGNETVRVVVAGGSYSARVTHQFYGKVDHAVEARVDPLGALEELREDNNVASESLSIVSFWGVVIDCPNPEAIIDAGTTWHYFAEVRNLGRYHNRIAMTLDGAPATWSVSVTPASFTLGPAGSPSAAVTIDVKVGTDPATQAGEYPMTVTATSQNETRDTDSVDLTTVIKGRWGVHLAPSDVRRAVAPGDAVVYRFNTTNIGNSLDSFTVEAIVPSPDPDWGVNVFPLRIDNLGPDASTNVTLSVSAPYEAPEGEYLTVNVRVTSVGDASRSDESTTTTTVVVPDMAVTGFVYRRADGSAVDGSAKRLVANETSQVAARIVNVRKNVDVYSLRVWVTVDGTRTDVIVPQVPAGGEAEAVVERAFSAAGTHTVEAVVDPYARISDADRGNNQLTSSFTVKGPQPVGPFDIEGIVHMPDGVTPAAGATVRVRVASSGYSLSVSADGSGLYSVGLGDTRYVDGDEVVLNATDGRDFAERTVRAYSEDLAAVVDLTLVEGQHYDIELSTPDTEPEVDGGQTVRIPVTLRSMGNRATVVDLRVTSPDWVARLLDESDETVTQAQLGAGASVALVLEIVVPEDAMGGTVSNVSVRATSQDAPDSPELLNVTATVRTKVGFSLEVTQSPSGDAHSGDTRTHTVTVRSLGNVDDTVDLSYDPAMQLWCVTFDVDPVPLAAFSSVAVRVSLTIPEGVEEKEYDIAISGQSTESPTFVNRTYITEMVVLIVRTVELEPVARQRSARPGETSAWSVVVRNAGNVEDTYGLAVVGLPTGYDWVVKDGTVAITEVRLAPGAQRTVLAEVAVPTEFDPSPPPTRVYLTLKATSRTDRTAFAGVELELGLEGILDLSLRVDTSTGRPTVGERVTFTLHVTNTGPANASGILVFAYLDETRPARKTITLVGAQDTVDETMEWYPVREGTLKVRIVINPLGQNATFFELDRANNEWNATFDVQPSSEDSLLRSGVFWGALFVIVLVGVVLYFLLPGRGPSPPEGGAAKRKGPQGKAGRKPTDKAGEKKGGPKPASKAKEGKEGKVAKEGEGKQVAGKKEPSKGTTPKTSKGAPPKATKKGRAGGRSPPKKRPPKEGAGEGSGDLDTSMFGGKM